MGMSGNVSAHEPLSSSQYDAVNEMEAPGAVGLSEQHEEARKFLAQHASEGQNFTLRGILVGLGVGLIICFSVRALP